MDAPTVTGGLKTQNGPRTVPAVVENTARIGSSPAAEKFFAKSPGELGIWNKPHLEGEKPVTLSCEATGRLLA